MISGDAEKLIEQRSEAQEYKQLFHPLAQIFAEPDIYFHYLWIKHKMSGKLVRFGETINTPQRYGYQELRKAQTAVGLRAIFLKYRQFGWSTAVEAMLFQRTATNYNIYTAVVSYRMDSAKHLKTILQLFYSRLPPEVKPVRRHNNQEELTFNDRDGTGLNSYMKVYCAESGDLGASFTINQLHVTEISRWSKAKDTLHTLSQAIPKSPSSVYILESTAKGAGKYFHQVWKESEEAVKMGLKPAFFPIFIPWYIDDDYVLDFEEGAKQREHFVQTLDADDKKYMKQYNLTPERMYWRSEVMRNDCRSSPILFAQEYPANSEEAFAYADESVFDQTALHEQAKGQKAPKYINLKTNMPVMPQEADAAAKFWMNSANSYDIMRLPKELIRAVPADMGSAMALFFPPEPNSSYVAFTDVASGHVNKRYSNISTIIQQQFSQSPNFTRVVVDFTGQMPLDQYAYLLVLLCHWFNDAILGIEVNPGGHGGEMMRMVFHELKYTNVYRRFSFSSATGGYTDELGWLTTSTTRPMMIDVLERAIDNGDIMLTSGALISECHSFVMSEDARRPEPAAGFKGDRVISCAGGRMVHLAHPPSPIQIEDEMPGPVRFPREIPEQLRPIEAEEAYYDLDERDDSFSRNSF